MSNFPIEYVWTNDEMRDYYRVLEDYVRTYLRMPPSWQNEPPSAQMEWKRDRMERLRPTFALMADLRTIYCVPTILQKESTP